MCRVEVTSPEGFIQQLVCLVRNGYWFYVTGKIPEGKDAYAVDRKLLGRYRIDISKWVRYRRKQAGLANVQYLRYRRFFVMLATEGPHRLRDEEKEVKDITVEPLKFHGYAVSYRGGHVHVRIERERYKELKAYFVEFATKTSAEHLKELLSRLPFEPYAPVRRQLLCIQRAVNGARKAAGLELVAKRCFRFRPQAVKPFEPVRGRDAALAA